MSLVHRIRRRATKEVRLFRRDHLDDFAFVHINKTGGSSVERALGLPIDHRTALEWRHDLGEREWRRRFTFSVVRNPWDRTVSHYHYRVQTNQTGLGDAPIGFGAWVRRVFADRDPRYLDQPKMFMPQTDWLSDEDGELLVDRVCHFEHLAEEVAQVGDEIGRALHLPHVKASPRGPYRTYYDDETRRLIGAWFRDDIDRFDYSF